MISDSIGYQKPTGTFMSFIQIQFSMSLQSYQHFPPSDWEAHGDAQYADATHANSIISP